MVDKKTQGKQNRQSGAAFELKVRKDLESKGWIVAKWTNNVEFTEEKIEFIGNPEDSHIEQTLKARLIPAKRKYNPFMKALSLGTGFPDFIVYSAIKNLGELPSFDINGKLENHQTYTVLGVEAKSNGYLDKEEKEKCAWLLQNNIFSKILIAKRGKKRGEIIYEEYK